MRLQQEIVREVNRRFIGREFRVLMETQDDKDPGRWTGRSYMDAPEIDGSVLVRTGKVLTVGKFYTVKITDIQDYDLVGEI